MSDFELDWVASALMFLAFFIRPHVRHTCMSFVSVRGQQHAPLSLSQLCSPFSVCVNQVLTFGSCPLPQWCLSLPLSFLFALPLSPLRMTPLYSSTKTLELRLLTPVSPCSHYVVIAETIDLVNLRPSYLPSLFIFVVQLVAAWPFSVYFGFTSVKPVLPICKHNHSSLLMSWQWV